MQIQIQLQDARAVSKRHIYTQNSTVHTGWSKNGRRFSYASTSSNIDKMSNFSLLESGENL